MQLQVGCHAWPNTIEYIVDYSKQNGIYLRFTGCSEDMLILNAVSVLMLCHMVAQFHGVQSSADFVRLSYHLSCIFFSTLSD